MKCAFLFLILLLFSCSLDANAASHVQMTDAQILSQTATDYGPVTLSDSTGNTPRGRLWEAKTKTTLMGINGPSNDVTDAYLVLFFVPGAAKSSVQANLDTAVKLVHFVKGVDPSWTDGPKMICKLSLQAGALPNGNSVSLIHDGLKFKFVNNPLKNLTTQILDVTPIN